MSNGNAAAQEADKQLERLEADQRRLGEIPQTAFSALMDDAVVHAARTVPADNQAATRPWRNLGPRNIGGRIRALAMHPRDGRTLYAGSALGGVWKTLDTGDSWRVLDDFRPPSGAHQALPVGAIAVAPSEPETLYVGTGEPVSGYISGNGLFWSHNGGAHFEQIDHPDSGTIRAKHYERIRVDPWEPRRLWCATPDRGLWRGRPGNPPRFVQDVVDAPGAPAAGSQQATDLVVDFGDPRGTPPARYQVFVALRGAGVYRASFLRDEEDYDGSGATIWTQVNIPGLAGLPGFHRVKLALCESRPQRMYCVAGISNTGGANDDQFSPVFRSDSGGAAWAATATQPGSTGSITWYALVLECSPTDPDVVFIGQVDMWRTTDGGATWGTADPTPPPNFRPCLDRTRYGQGDRAQHADQHAVAFDRDRARRVWVGNDGGVSFSADLGTSWRKRSHGILATQFNDISTHPTYPFLMGGGLQDNGSWISYGGLSWYNVGHSDGGDIGFEPGDPRLFHVSAQQGVWRGRMATAFAPDAPGFPRPNPAPDIPLALNASGSVSAHGQFVSTAANGIPLADAPPFYAVLVHHPSNNNEALVGRRNNAYRTTDGSSFAALGHAAFNLYGGANAEVSALAYGPSPNNDWWVTTSRGEVSYTWDGGTNWRNATEPTGARGTWISAVAAHPSNSNIAAIAVASNPGTVYLTGDGGQTWLELSGRPGAGGANWQPRPTPNDSDRFCPAPATALVFDPNSPNAVGSAQTLYVGTLTGVYVIRNAIPPTTATPQPGFEPVWRTFNQGLPLVLVYDMERVRFQDAAGALHNRLRIATFGRGVYEVDLGATAATRLLIRRHIDDHGLALPGANRLTEEPRLAPGTNLVEDRSIDIRVDVPPYLYLGRVAEAVELDERLRSDDLAADKLNLIYVQVHNLGNRAAGVARVSLYWAEAPGAPPAAPDLPADFWDQYPKDDATPWRRIDTLEARGIESGAPAVVRFQWQVPGTVPANVALLALVTDDARDRLVGPGPTPATSIAALVGGERRVALRVLPSTPSPADALLRDGFDDRGRLGETAWAARSHDIVVAQGVAGDPNALFADADDRRAADVLDGSDTNQIFVRVSNKGGQPLNNVQLELFRIPPETLQDPNSWHSLGTVNLAGVPAGATRFAPVIEWPNPPDPGVVKGYLLAALVSADGDPRPDFLARVDSVASFWSLFLEAVDSGNAALRGLRWRA
jgi:photosystem II stability/assembly factor-like uncharacterized protein